MRVIQACFIKQFLCDRCGEDLDLVKSLLRSGVPLVVSTAPEVREASWSCLGCHHPALQAVSFWAPRMMRQWGREVLMQLVLCPSLSTGLVQYSLSADPQRAAAGNEPEELCSDHRGRRSASVWESHFPGEYSSSAPRVPLPGLGRSSPDGKCCCGRSPKSGASAGW